VPVQSANIERAIGEVPQGGDDRIPGRAAHRATRGGDAIPEVSEGENSSNGAEGVDGVAAVDMISLVPVAPVTAAVGALLGGQGAHVLARRVQHDGAVEPWQAGGGPEHDGGGGSGGGGGGGGDGRKGKEMRIYYIRQGTTVGTVSCVYMYIL
jgi:hypothetical protein